jgi:hypothetical protein
MPERALQLRIDLGRIAPVAHTDSFLGVYFPSCRFTSG